MSRVKPEGNTATSCRQKDSRVSIYERLSRSNIKTQTIFGALYTKMQKRNFTSGHF